jgi:ubiquinone/menaquinone biosynthesis C-methylase UbiE/DNA-binding transcriptional ArsR family regulator
MEFDPARTPGATFPCNISLPENIDISRFPDIVLRMDPVLVTLRALGDDTRLRLLGALRRGAFHVNELVRILAMGQSRVSRHLKILLDADLVTARREGNSVYYALVDAWAGGGTKTGLRFLPTLAEALASRQFPGADADEAAIGQCLDDRRGHAARFFKDVAGQWDTRRDTVQGPPWYLDQLAAVLGTSDTVVDLGTGTGVLLAALSPRARRVIGIDRQEEMLQVARRSVADAQLQNVELRLGTLEHLPIPDAEADTMVAHMVLHHVSHPPDALREIHRGLQPGGRFVVVDLVAHTEESYREHLGDLWLGFETEHLKGWLDAADFELEQFEELPSDNGRPGIVLLAARRREK